jgi:hypothetical protein
VVLGDDGASVVLPGWVLESPGGSWWAFVCFLMDFGDLVADPPVPMVSLIPRCRSSR